MGQIGLRFLRNVSKQGNEHSLSKLFSKQGFYWPDTCFVFPNIIFLSSKSSRHLIKRIDYHNFSLVSYHLFLCKNEVE